MTKIKKCTGKNSCGKQKKLSEFHNHPHGKYKVLNKCKECCKRDRKERYNRDMKNPISREKILNQKKVWLKKNIVKKRKRLNKYERNRRKTDIKFVIVKRLRGRINEALKGKNKSASTQELTGCTWVFLKQYIEKQFKEGMSWENRHLWHVDHIRPCASFDLSKEEEQKKCFHYSNLQPLWARENLTKGSKWTL